MRTLEPHLVLALEGHVVRLAESLKGLEDARTATMTDGAPSRAQLPLAVVIPKRYLGLGTAVVTKGRNEELKNKL